MLRILPRVPAACVLALACSLATAPSHARPVAGTFSIVACDSTTGELGVAVQSRYFSVGRVVPWAEAGVGAVATQASVNPTFGPRGLALLAGGLSPAEALRALAANDSLWDSRQVGIVDARGRSASWTGPRCLDWAGGEAGPSFACQGNILAGPAVSAGMARAFRETRGELAEKLIAALEAAQAAGGDKRGMQSAAVLVVRPSRTHPEYAQRYVDLRVEDHRDPIREMRRLWRIHEGFHGAGAHLAMAEEYAADGRGDLARAERERVAETLRRALERNERDPSLLNGLAWACATHDLEPAAAVRAAERAALLRPKDVDILDTLAEACYRAGDAKRAIEVETRAAALDPKSEYLKAQIERFRSGTK